MRASLWAQLVSPFAFARSGPLPNASEENLLGSFGATVEQSCPSVGYSELAANETRLLG